MSALGFDLDKFSDSEKGNGEFLEQFHILNFKELMECE